MTNSAPIHALTAVDLMRLYRSRQLSPVEVTRAILSRIERYDPAVKAFALLDSEAALASARQSEERWQHGKVLGLVDGVPTTLKDLILTKGWPTLRGSRAIDPSQSWAEDAPATARLREHGAVLLGKTTTSEFGWKSWADSPLTGITRNPWDVTRTAGGSSGGSVVAAALGFGPLHVATDGGGSARLPAAFSGVFGFKATFGRVPCYPSAHSGTLFNIAPNTRTVGDAAILLSVIGQPDPRDWYALPSGPRDWREGLDGGVAGLRIAFSPTLGYAQVDPQVSAIVAEAVRVLADRGAIVEAVDPGIEDPREIFHTLWFAAAARLIDGLAPNRRSLVEPGLRTVAEQGRGIDVVTYLQAVEAREALGRKLNEFHQEWDLLITPTTAVTAFAAEYPHEDLAKRPVPSPFTYQFNSIHSGWTDCRGYACRAADHRPEIF
jgi:aspartyl-tRNA(Asn)/glutamyl-tRNA(Gln) amidotransferase subunit A